MVDPAAGAPPIRLALLGDPVAHSRSPAIHEAALRAVGIRGSYEARRTDAHGMERACAEIRSGALDGVNVTMPLKAVALEAVDRASKVAIRAGAVNTVCLRDGSAVGENTDVGGIRDAWRRRRLPDDVPILVLGAGAAAAAALLAREGSELLVSSRRSGMSSALAARLEADAIEIPWRTAVPGAVVVNATPLGMDDELLPGDILDEASGLFDMAYGASTTPAVAAMRDRPVADGIDMLIAQAARSFQIWTGVAAPFDLMEAAARA